MNTLKMNTNKYPKRHLLKTCYTSEIVACHVKVASLEDLCSYQIRKFWIYSLAQYIMRDTDTHSKSENTVMNQIIVISLFFRGVFAL